VGNAVCALPPGRWDAVVLAAPVHAGRHLPEMTTFVSDHLAGIQRLPPAFISVSASQASAEQPELTPEKRARFAAEVQDIVDRFSTETRWRPSKIKLVAGTLLGSHYNPLVRFLIKQVARRSGEIVNLSEDQEFTNWEDLDEFIREFVGELPSLVETYAR
jgi:menaquinone-dependent protoporphyrinogen oxidase